MKIKRSLPLMIILVMILLLLVSTAYAQRPERQRMMSKTGIGLTQDQKEKIRKTRLGFAKEKIRLKADLKIARLELRSLMTEEELDRDDIYEKIEDIGELRIRLAKNRVDKRMALREILTKEQLEKLKEFKFRKLKRKTLSEYRKHFRKPLPPGRPNILEEFPQRGKRERLLPEAEEVPLIEPEGSFYETPELGEEAELIQLLEELKLAPLLEEK